MTENVEKLKCNSPRFPLTLTWSAHCVVSSIVAAEQISNKTELNQIYGLANDYRITLPRASSLLPRVFTASQMGLHRTGEKKLPSQSDMDIGKYP
jgi:hypothetical protein